MGTRLLTPCTIVQAAIPMIFNNVPQSFFTQTMEVFERNANICYALLSRIPGLKPMMPAGAMYIMVSATCYIYQEQRLCMHHTTSQNRISCINSPT